MKVLLVYFSLVALIISACCARPRIREGLEINIIDDIAKNGYPVEIHEIKTKDGYLLDIYRIPFGKKTVTQKTNEYPAVLMHGILGSAENFLIAGPRKGLAYILADSGYDVWVCNARGSRHSRKHERLNPDVHREFWQFTWHEIGVYDIPAIIDHVLQTTNKTKLHYIGHSQGTTSFFVMASERPEYNDKIKVMLALAPAVYLKNIRIPFFKLLATCYSFLEKWTDSLKLYELFPFMLNDILRDIGNIICGNQSTDACDRIFFKYLEENEDQLDSTIIPLIEATEPAGASVKQFLHFAQIIVSGVFQNYDWGKKENLRRYKSAVPPKYNLKNVNAPVALFYGNNDGIVNPKGVIHLAKMLPNVIELYKVPYENWTHLDFLWAKDVNFYLHKKVLQVMNHYNRE